MLCVSSFSEVFFFFFIDIHDVYTQHLSRGIHPPPSISSIHICNFFTPWYVEKRGFDVVLLVCGLVWKKKNQFLF